MFLAAAFAIVLVITMFGGCSGSETSNIPPTTTSPSLYAECVHLSPADLEKKKQQYRERIADLSARLSQMKENPQIQIFIKNTAAQRDIDALGNQAKSMSEVKSVEYVSKEEALQRLRQSFQGHEDVLNALTGNPLPASFELKINDPTQLEEVASRFFDNPIVDNSPGNHDGVDFDEAIYQQLEKQLSDMQDFLDNARSCSQQ
jgi:hypothetical protein